MLTCPVNMSSNESRISFIDLIDSKNLTQAFFSSFCVDFEWVQSYIACPMSILMHPDLNSRSLSGKTLKISKSIQVIFPPFYNKQFGVFHAKIMFLWMKSGLRFVVSSANLMECDYGRVQNILFVQDLDNLNDGHLKSDCYRQLLNFLNICKVPKDITTALRDFSWARVVAQIIFSIPGDSSSGLKMLKGQISSLPLFNSVEAQGSSLGALTRDWMDNFCSDVKVVFPTMRHASENPGGFETIFCREDNWTKCPVKNQFYQCISALRKEQALHSKILLFLNDTKIVGAYVGSHNFTPSAWGRYTKAGKLWITNYELGVLMKLDNCSFQCPYERPLEAYEYPSDTPWFQ